MRLSAPAPVPHANGDLARKTLSALGEDHADLPQVRCLMRGVAQGAWQLRACGDLVLRQAGDLAAEGGAGVQSVAALVVQMHEMLPD